MRMTRDAVVKWSVHGVGEPHQYQHHSTRRKQRVTMASFNRERVEHALNELLVRIVPDDPDEDEEVAEQRFEAAYDFAMGQLEADGPGAVVPDINHIASLVDRTSTTASPGPRRCTAPR